LSAPLGRPIRICLDVNIWVAYVLNLSRGRKTGLLADLIDLIESGNCEAGPVQLVTSLRMLATQEEALLRLGLAPDDIARFGAAIAEIMRHGPERVDPFLLPESAGSLPLHDTEDAGVLAVAFASRADLLITNNLADFAAKDAERLPTGRGGFSSNSASRDHALIFERNDGVALVVAHPFDALEWLREGIAPRPDVVRRYCSNQPEQKEE
jgi:predicted nucleic acid-binding protein